ncbi:MAG: heparan-alpha-glucosaminide N-acetyltransferase [Candidatus ainarchaeum sp.]|nr:heparan-alpha-glucosaminide N-acetyltransferase [Candidatus ainarchaeum sp.]
MGERIIEVDSVRGIAIVMMLFYHTLFDLVFLGMISSVLYLLPVVLFQRTIGFLFVITAGVALTLSESKNEEGYERHFLRALKLAAVAAMITLVTWIVVPDRFITFGVIHMLALSTLIAPIFFKLGKWNVVLGAAIMAIGLLVVGTVVDNTFLFWLGFPYPGYTALDYYPMLPWFGVVLLGMGLGTVIFPNGKPKFKIPKLPLMDQLAFLGRHSLTIYILHQPIILGILIALMLLR